MDQLEFLQLLKDRTTSLQLRDTIDNITSPIPAEFQKAAILQVIGPALANGGKMGSRSMAPSAKMNEQPIDEMTFFDKNSLFVQKRSNLRKKQLYDFYNIPSENEDQLKNYSRRSIPTSKFFHANRFQNPGDNNLGTAPGGKPIAAGGIGGNNAEEVLEDRNGNQVIAPDAGVKKKGGKNSEEVDFLFGTGEKELT